jgi:hypothetical protein
MISEHGLEYQVVDDSGGDGGLDGFCRTTGDLHAIYCPEKPASARFRQKFETDLKKAVVLRDKKQYPIKRFIFVTPEPLREPDQRTLRDLAQRIGFDDGINIAAEHLEALFAKHEELLPQFSELSYPQLEKTLNRVAEKIEQIHRAQESFTDKNWSSAKSFKITGAAAQILMLAVKTADKIIEGRIEAEEIIRRFDLTNEQYKDAMDELDELGLVGVSKSVNAPGGYQRVWIRPAAFVQVAPQVLRGIDIKAQLESLLQAFVSNPGEYVTADEILQKSALQPARAQILIDYLRDKRLVETSMLGQSMLFYYGRILPLGKRILEDKDELPT